MSATDLQIRVCLPSAWIFSEAQLLIFFRTTQEIAFGRHRSCPLNLAYIRSILVSVILVVIRMYFLCICLSRNTTQRHRWQHMYNGDSMKWFNHEVFSRVFLTVCLTSLTCLTKFCKQRFMLHQASFFSSTVLINKWKSADQTLFHGLWY